MVAWRPDHGCLAPDAAALSADALALLRAAREELEAYVRDRPAFLESLEPLPDDEAAPEVVRAMLRAGLEAGVGPMAAVAGAIAEAVGRPLADGHALAEIVVENGGDLWLRLREPLVVAVYAGLSSLSGTFGVRVGPGELGLACSSSTVGPSLSLGKADAAVALARNGALADAWATAVGNAVSSRSDPGAAARAVWSRGNRPDGLVVVAGAAFAAAGRVVLEPLSPPQT